MKFNISKLRNLAIAGVFLFTTSSCLNDLDVKVDDDELYTSEQFYSNPESYKQFLAKIYAGLAVTGQSSSAGTGSSDLGSEADGGPNEGFSQYLRGYWQLQELTTDEAIIAWGESDNPTIRDLNFNTWNADNVFNEAFFARLFFQVGLVNEFLRETTDEKLSSRGVSEELKGQIKTFRAEARFLRALTYYHAIDIYGKMPFATENDVLGTKPVMQSREFMFNYVIEELTSLEADLPAPKMNEYGRADKAAVWMLKAKLYLNANVYLNADKSTEALTEVEKVIGSAYKVAQIPYANLFMADNNTNGAQDEIIFPIAFDGVRTKTYGGTTYLIHASCTNEVGTTLGIDFGWQGFRVRQEFMQSVGTDQRVMKVAGNTDDAFISDYSKFEQGVKLIKFSNKTSTGASGSDLNFTDADFPVFRMADAYLMYAELAVVNGKGSLTNALTYVNALRVRGGVPIVLQSALNKDFILKERARELYWEGYRRQDLIRFGQYTSGYNWQWKGGSINGNTLPETRKLFPIPSKYLNLNSNLSQNPGY
jgi:hypothetical protein